MRFTTPAMTGAFRAATHTRLTAQVRNNWIDPYVKKVLKRRDFFFL